MVDLPSLLRIALMLFATLSSSFEFSVRYDSRQASSLLLYNGLGELSLAGSTSFVNQTSVTMALPLPPRQSKEEKAPKEAGSLGRAIKQVHAIMDLYYAQPDTVSANLVLTTVQQVVLGSKASSENSSNDLEELETLVWRLGTLRLTPSFRIMDTLWKKQERQHQKASKQVGRMIRLLHNWYEWSGPNLEAPPPSYLQAVLRHAADNQLTMSFALWDLCLVAIARQERLHRSAYESFLLILARSPSEWRTRQCLILQAMTNLARESEQVCAPTKLELERALRVSAREGHAQDAAWLSRNLHALDDDKPLETKTLFVEALWHSDLRGSLHYMEKYVFSTQDLDHRAYKMLLAKWSRHREPGSGMRAETVFKSMIKKLGDSWVPDVESIHSVVLAYLQEHTVSLKHVRDADRFLRRACKDYGLTTGAQSGRWRIFDRLLDAYTDYSVHDTFASRQAERLFQFFLVQHRRGRVAEEPNPFHLGHLLRQWNRRLPIRESAARKSLDAVQLYASMHRRGTISAPPDAYNIRQLLGTLARSNVTGYGEAAESFLPQVASVKDPYTAGHMYWCVVKCHCNSLDRQGIQRAIAILDRMEVIYHENPNSIRLTGAPYQTVLSTLVVVSSKNDDDEAQAGFCSTTADEVLVRLEALSRAGNRYARLQRKLYRDAIVCHENDPPANNVADRIQFCQERLQALEQDGTIPVEQR